MLLIQLFFGSLQPLYSKDTDSANVLVIYSHHANFPWVSELQKGIEDSLQGIDYYLYAEYLNEHQLSEYTDFDELYQAMYLKYKDVRFDVIIVADNYAFDFLSMNYNKLWKSVPVVFVAVNGYDAKSAFTDSMTGIAQNSDMRSLIELVLKINDEDPLLFLSSKNATSTAELKSIESIIQRDFPDLEYQFISADTLETVLNEVQKYEHAQLIQIGNIITDNGTMLAPDQLISRIFEVTGFPIYTGNILHITEGDDTAVGGVVVDPYTHAFQAGLMARKILEGEDVGSMKPRTSPLVSMVFNARMLDHFDIDSSSLPPGSILVGLDDDRILISEELAVSIGIGALILMVFLLLLLNKAKVLKKEVEKSLRIQNELALSTEKFHTYIHMSPVGIFIVDQTGRCIEANKKACEITGYSEEELLEISLKELHEKIGTSEGGGSFDDFIGNGSRYEHHIHKKDGTGLWLSCTSARIYKEHTIIFCWDITERKQRESKIEYLSLHDPTTKVHNRRYFEEELLRLDTPEFLPLSYIICDTNGLKFINDTMGHAVGDLILKETARVLTLAVRKGDVLSRIGGDEFAVLLPNTSKEEIQKVLSRIIIEFKHSELNVEGESIHLSVALGSATKSDSEQQMSHILKVAEDMMYRSKLLERSSSHSSLLNSLRKSLSQRTKETDEHGERLIHLTSMIGKALVLPQSSLNDLKLFATMHDIGKMSIDNSILMKPGPLNDDEWLEMRKHPRIGYNIAMTSPDLSPIAHLILCHHERWDGQGYPQGLKGEDIPLLSRILAIADAYDAMTSDRPYRSALPKETAIEQIEENKWTQFDPGLSDLFITLIQKSDDNSDIDSETGTDGSIEGET